MKSISSDTAKQPIRWRNQLKQSHLISQISSILLQRHNWPSLLQTLNLKSKLTPSLFLQILKATQTHPQISLNFFEWAIKSTSFKPDLAVQCKMTHILIGSGLINPAKPILNSLIQDYPPAQIVKSLISSYEKGTIFDDQSTKVLGSVLHWYCEKGLCLQALEVFNLTRDINRNKALDDSQFISVHSYNTLLTALQENNEAKLAWCLYALMLRNRVVIDQFTWRIIAKMLSKEGKVDSIVRIIDMGMHDPLIYDLVIGCCSEKGLFKVALHMFDEMCKRKLNPGFDTCISILDGACRHKNDEVIDFAMESMVDKGYISKPLTGCDLVIQKLCNMKKTYSANMLFKSASDEQIPLEDETYGCMLRAFSTEARVTEAIGIFRIMEQRGIKVKNNYYDEFTDVLCKEDPSKEVNDLLIDMISRGFKPSSLELSKYITSQCNKRRWEEAEELVNLALEKSILLEASCCGSLIKHYCSRRRIDLAINMHDKMEKQELTWDSNAYNVLLRELLGEVRKVEEAERIFDYMRRKKLLSSQSFLIMISGLCRGNELRKAMKLHDEMLEMGFKPGAKTYRRLIYNFK